MSLTHSILVYNPIQHPPLENYCFLGGRTTGECYRPVYGDTIHTSICGQIVLLFSLMDVALRLWDAKLRVHTYTLHTMGSTFNG